MDKDGKAVKVFQSLLKHFPDDYETHRWLADYYLEDDKPDKAERYAKEAATAVARSRHGEPGVEPAGGLDPAVCQETQV